MWQLALVDMEPAKLGTAVEIGKHLARIQEMAWVESTFQPLLLFEIILGELDIHQVALFDADKTPPISTQLRRMSAPNSSARSSSPGWLASNRISG